MNTTQSRSFLRRPAARRLLGLALGAAIVLAACSQDDDVVGVDADGNDITREQILETADADGDGVVTELEFDRALAAIDVSPSDFEIYLDETSADEVVASGPAGDLTIGDVRSSLDESPPSGFVPGNIPDQSQFTARLTSMLRLRLSAQALTDLGFPVDQSGTDSEINDQVAALIEGEFEAWATQRVLERRPEVEKLAAPHCLSLLVLPSEQEALDARARVEAGERVFDVASELNFEDTTEVGGGLGCNDVLSWSNTFGIAATDLGELEEGEMTEPSMVPSEASPTGELWIVIHIDDIPIELSDPSVLGPFAGPELTEQMMTYFVDVDAEIGEWNVEALSISLPS